MPLYVNTTNLTEVANDINSRRQSISELYSGEIKSILRESENAIKASGLNFDELSALYDGIFYNLDAKLYNIHHVLTNKIIPSYETLGENLGKAFNNDFAEQMKDLIS